MAKVLTYPFTPTPRQAEAMLAYADEILYGGAAGGGKSEWERAEAIRMALTVPGSRTLILRRTFPQLRETMIVKLLEAIPRGMATYNKTDHTWTFTNGSVIVLGHLQYDESVVNYQGTEWQLICWDELTQFTEYQYTYMLSRLRASGRVLDRMNELGLRPRMIAAANPGGIGHAWVKARWIDLAPAGTLFAVEDDDGHLTTRVFISAKVADNPHVDTGYLRRLNQLDPDTRRALREGDWDAYTGQRFSGWRVDTHVITPEQAAQLMPPVGGIRTVGVDYGMDAPFAAHWMWLGPDGLVVIYRELYEADLTPNEQAKAILAAEAPGERDSGRPIPVALDPSTWARNAHTKPALNPKLAVDVPPPGSIAHSYWRVFGGQLVKANNDRLAGVALVADKLRVRRDGMPRLLVVDTCRNLIRTLPALIRDPRRPEDVNTDGEDHAYDAMRYGLMELSGRRPDRDHTGQGKRAAHVVRKTAQRAA